MNISSFFLSLSLSLSLSLFHLCVPVCMTRTRADRRSVRTNSKQCASFCVAYGFFRNVHGIGVRVSGCACCVCVCVCIWEDDIVVDMLLMLFFFSHFREYKAQYN